MVTIRPAEPRDGAVLRQVERLAGERFRDVGMDRVAEDEPPGLDILSAYAVAGRSWVAVAGPDDGGGAEGGSGTSGGGGGPEEGTPVGYVLVDVVDGCAHVEQVTVRPDHQGRGVGRALMDRVRDWAVATGRRAVTLTTFSEVPWNRPLYEHLGYRVLSESEIGPGLSAVRDAETAHGLDPATRVCMRLDLPA